MTNSTRLTQASSLRSTPGGGATCKHTNLQVAGVHLHAGVEWENLDAGRAAAGWCTQQLLVHSNL